MPRNSIEQLASGINPILIVVSMLIVASISYIRYHTGPEYAFSIFYFFPIVLITWKIGFWPGIVFSVLCALSWLTADLKMLHAFSTPWVPFINETFRLMVFLVAVTLIWKFKTALSFQQHLARTDTLTGLANRRAFMEFAALELKRAERFSTPMTILCMDIDNFKTVNDRYGHQCGDRLLKMVSLAITNNIRSIDMAARFGGDEFCVLFTNTDKNSADIIIKKLGQKLTAAIVDNHWPVTFSAGVASFDTPPASIDAMIGAADALMYRAKQTGKDKTVHQAFTGK